MFRACWVFKSSVYILGSNPLADTHLQIFLSVCSLSSHSLDSVLGGISFVFFFIKWRPIISWCIMSLVLYLKIIRFPPGCWHFLPILSSWAFIVLHFVFRFKIHFELNSLKEIKSVSILCSIALSLLFVEDKVDYIYGGLFWGSLYCSIDMFVCSFTNTPPVLNTTAL